MIKSSFAEKLQQALLQGLGTADPVEAAAKLATKVVEAPKAMPKIVKPEFPATPERDIKRPQLAIGRQVVSKKVFESAPIQGRQIDAKAVVARVRQLEHIAVTAEENRQRKKGSNNGPVIIERSQIAENIRKAKADMEFWEKAAQMEAIQQEKERVAAEKAARKAHLDEVQRIALEAGAKYRAELAAQRALDKVKANVQQAEAALNKLVDAKPEIVEALPIAKAEKSKATLEAVPKSEAQPNAKQAMRAAKLEKRERLTRNNCFANGVDASVSNLINLICGVE